MRTVHPVRQRSTGAGVYTGAATDTGTLQESRAIGKDTGLLAAIPYPPGDLPLNLIANAHTTITTYTARHIHVDVRVAVIAKCCEWPALLVCGRMQAIFHQITMKGEVRLQDNRLRRIMSGHQGELGTAQTVQRIALAAYYHAVNKPGAASRDRTRLSVDFNHAETASAIWFEPRVMTKMRHVVTRALQSVEQA
jgi:hypothetical protein